MKLSLYTTVYGRKEKEETAAEYRFGRKDLSEMQLISLYPDVTYQTFEGFGGALTDAAGYVYAGMDDAARKKAVNAYFGADGAGYVAARMPVDSCDFSLEQFEAVSDADDAHLETFDLTREKKYIFPLLRDVEKTLGKPVELMVSPWSPPHFMKTNGERARGGGLKPEYRARYAAYLCRYIRELKALGLNVRRMSVQNEPKATQTWDSCIMTAREEKEFLRDYLYPAMEQNGLTDVELFIWDHNKERAYERACAVIDDTTDKMIAGVAFHWYSGDHFEALQLLRRKFPDKKLILSEACIEYSIYKSVGGFSGVYKYAHDIMGNLNAGMNAFYDWNILLDGKGGPNYVGNFCDAPLLYHTDENRLEERFTLSAIGHFSRYIKPGAVRIAFSRYTDELEVTAFKNPGGEIVFVAMNRSEHGLPVTLCVGEQKTSFGIAAHAVCTGSVVS